MQEEPACCRLFLVTRGIGNKPSALYTAEKIPTMIGMSSAAWNRTEPHMLRVFYISQPQAKANTQVPPRKKSCSEA